MNVRETWITLILFALSLACFDVLIGKRFVKTADSILPITVQQATENEANFDKQPPLLQHDLSCTDMRQFVKVL